MSEEEIASLQQEIARLAGELEAAKQAAREILAERNTWARELADMRDERNTARDEFEKARTLWNQNDTTSLARIVNLEEAIRNVLEEYDTKAPPWVWTPDGIEKMRRALNDD